MGALYTELIRLPGSVLAASWSGRAAILRGMEPMPQAISYRLEPYLDPREFIDVLVRSQLAERRPVGDAEVIAGMLAHADVILTARASSGLLVGVSRAVTDFSYCTYLSDLAVDASFQRQGIGRQLVRRTHEAAGLQTSLILLSAPKAQSYYPHIGMRRHDSCWIVDRSSSPTFPG
jgi:GNAT superfamily N-acetyltransferase